MKTIGKHTQEILTVANAMRNRYNKVVDYSPERVTFYVPMGVIKHIDGESAVAVLEKAKNSAKTYNVSTEDYLIYMIRDSDILA